MLKTVKNNIFENINNYSIIFHQCNINGKNYSPFSMEIFKQWPQVQVEYLNYCKQFENCPKDSVNGTFITTKINDQLIICTSISQVSTTNFNMSDKTDLDLLNKVCRTIERQTRINNEQNKLNWTIHTIDNIGSEMNIGNYNDIHTIFEYNFQDSIVNVVFHKL